MKPRELHQSLGKTTKVMKQLHTGEKSMQDANLVFIISRLGRWQTPPTSRRPSVNASLQISHQSGPHLHSQRGNYGFTDTAEIRDSTSINNRSCIL